MMVRTYADCRNSACRPGPCTVGLEAGGAGAQSGESREECVGGASVQAQFLLRVVIGNLPFFVDRRNEEVGLR